jgi:UDP-glucose 4-epimerase
MNVLVCGGAGYIGSTLARMLEERGDRVVVFDNLGTSS